MQRVMILGGPGSGKSTLARMLGERTGLPVHHMDHIHWQDGWVERTAREKRPLALAIEAQERWVFEGGLSSTYENRLARADTCIWLDLPVSLRLWRVTRRTLRYFGRARPDLPQGCPERLNLQTVAFYRFIWRSRHSGRARVERLLAGATEDKTIHHLRSPEEVRAFLRTVEDRQRS